MNTKQETAKDFLRLQKVLRELRFLRYNFFDSPADKLRIEKAIQELAPLSDKLKSKLEALQKPAGDYDI